MIIYLSLHHVYTEIVSVMFFSCGKTDILLFELIQMSTCRLYCTCTMWSVFVCFISISPSFICTTAVIAYWTQISDLYSTLSTAYRGQKPAPALLLCREVDWMFHTALKFVLWMLNGVKNTWLFATRSQNTIQPAITFVITSEKILYSVIFQHNLQVTEVLSGN